MVTKKKEIQRTNINLYGEHYEFVRKLAYTRNVSMSEVIRQIIEDYVEQIKKDRR